MGKIALGRGLEALIPITTDAEAKEGRLVSIPLDKIVPNPYQPRKSFDEQKLRELADSFKVMGMLQPILAKKQGAEYILIAGERRYRAAKMAALDSIPAMIIEDATDESLLEMALIENIQRENLNPLETATAYRALMNKCDWTQNELAGRLGKNRASVANTLRLLTLPENIQALIAEGKLSEGHARAILSVADPLMREKIAARILSESLSVRQVEALSRKGKRRRLVVKRQSPEVEEAETFMKHLLGTSVKIVPGLKKGRIEVEYYGNEDLNRILDLMRKIM